MELRRGRNEVEVDEEEKLLFLFPDRSSLELLAVLMAYRGRHEPSAPTLNPHSKRVTYRNSRYPPYYPPAKGAFCFDVERALKVSAKLRRSISLPAGRR